MIDLSLPNLFSLIPFVLATVTQEQAPLGMPIRDQESQIGQTGRQKRATTPESWRRS